MSDTLIMLSRTGDRLCADVIEPDHTPYRLFYSNFEELSDVLVEAHEHGLSGEACRHVIDIALAAACANETPREPWKARTPPAAISLRDFYVDQSPWFSWRVSFWLWYTASLAAVILLALWAGGALR